MPHQAWQGFTRDCLLSLLLDTSLPPLPLFSNVVPHWLSSGRLAGLHGCHCFSPDYNRGQNCWDDQPTPPLQSNVEISSFRSGEATQLCTGGGGGIISSSYMNSSVCEWSTEFVVSILSMIVDYEVAFQLILTRIVACCSAHLHYC